MSKPATQLAVPRVEVITDESGFDALKGDWENLLEESNQDVYFLSWNWNWLWWKIYAPPSSRLYLVVCYNKSGQLVGLAPLYWRQIFTAGVPHLGEALYLGTGIPITTSEYMNLIARRGYEREVGQAIASFILGDKTVDRLWLSEIPITSMTLPHFREALGPRQVVLVTNRSHYIDTGVDWNTFKQGLGKSSRTKLDRCTRRLFKTFECEFRCVQNAEELDSAIVELIQLHQARWHFKGESGSFALPGVEELLAGAMRSSFREGRLRVWTLSLDGRTAAVLLAFVSTGIAHYFQGGFDPKYASFSLGTVMFGLCIGACIEADDINAFDFMGGDASYKEHWTKLGRDSVSLEWLRPGIRSSFFSIVDKGENAGKAFLRMIVPQAIRAVRRKRSKAARDF